LTSLYGSSTPSTLGDVAIGRWFDGRQRLIVVAMTVVLVTALALILAVRGYNTLLEETFYDRSLAYVQAFAASAEAWVEPLNVEMLRSAARFMLVGSALFVRIEIAGDLVVDEREETDALDSLADPSPSSGGETLRLPSGRTYLDVSVPLSGSSETVGSVRIGIDTTGIVVRGRSTALAATGVAVGVDALVLVLLFWSHLGRARREVGDEYASQEAVPAPILVGDLRIDRATKRVRLKGEDVDLTPKQFALLEFLAQRSDRVVSEEEIVDGVWVGSHYADSKDVKQYVYLVRKRLAKADPGGRDLITTVPGFGYRLTSDPVDEELTGG
jgi:DNA-binding winged helix-turn-helix (wHTH) protein